MLPLGNFYELFLTYLQYALFIRRRMNFSLSSGPRLVSAAKYSMRINLSRSRARSEAKAAEAPKNCKKMSNYYFSTQRNAKEKP